MLKHQSFEQWMQQVEIKMYRICGMGPDDLPDWCYRDAYDSDMTPAEAAQDAVESARDY